VTVAIAHQQHPDQKFGVNRGPPGGAVKRRQLGPHLIQLDEPVDGAQHVVGGNVLIQREVVQKRRLFGLFTHHRKRSRFDYSIESALSLVLNDRVFQQNPPQLAIPTRTLFAAAPPESR